MTAHKAQGQTLNNVVVDLDCCRVTEAPYVMILRVKSLEGLIILQKFQKSHIDRRQSEDYHKEHNRLMIL
ncbi:hypothetical protein EDD18DRAFT_1077940 [Armillaria luteobubalina]|uniref:UvrD-like helicase C-terminal domain-containing protein n=1 Tax=Armillaria luteobubalina TaxID=153913 RepID=A0AA39UR51_9AGAR|nr:hypothetical protein EDD18DRAFT_1077940 [Armillaria luteobubalina]